MTELECMSADEVSAAWARQGYDASDVAVLTEATLTGERHVDMTYDQLIRHITAHMRAYNIPVERSIGIINVLSAKQRRE